MALRKNLCLTISMAAYFQDFDNGKEITQRVPKSWNLEAGDLVKWEYAQFSGIAKIVGCWPDGDELVCIFKET